MPHTTPHIKLRHAPGKCLALLAATVFALPGVGRASEIVTETVQEAQVLAALRDRDLEHLDAIQETSAFEESLDVAVHKLEQRVAASFSYARDAERALQSSDAFAANKQLPHYKQRAGAASTKSTAKVARHDSGAWALNIATDRTDRDVLDRSLGRAIQVALAPLERCWDRVMLSGRDRDGYVQLKLTISETGSIEHVVPLENDIENTEFKKCLLRSVQRLQLATPVGERLTIHLPIHLRAQAQ